nr:protein sieve element occlusion B-like [Tanacetum cinerariifolium]
MTVQQIRRIHQLDTTLDVRTQQILDSKGAIPTKAATDAKIAIQEMLEYSQKWHNGTSLKTRSWMQTMQRTTLHKGSPLKEEGNTLEEAYYTQFGAPYQPTGQYRAAGPGFYQHNNGNSSYPDQRQTLEESLTKFMAESGKRHEENSNIMKEIRASTDVDIRNQGSLIKTLEIQIGQMSKPWEENYFRKYASVLRLFETPGLVESCSPKLDLFSNIKERLEEEETIEIMMKTMEQYMSKAHGNYGLGFVRPKINDETHFELKGQYLKELRENTFSGSKHEDTNENIEKVLEIVDLFHIPEMTQDQVMLRVFPMLDVRTQQILDSKGAIPTKAATDAKIAIQEMLEYSQKWHNGTSLKTRSWMQTMQRTTLHKGSPLKEEGNTLEEAYYTQFGAPYQPTGQYRAAGPGFYQHNNGNSSYPDQRQTLEESLTKFMAESGKRHEENSNIMKEIRASTDVDIRNQGSLIKTLEIQIGDNQRGSSIVMGSVGQMGVLDCEGSHSYGGLQMNQKGFTQTGIAGTRGSFSGEWITQDSRFITYTAEATGGHLSVSVIYVTSSCATSSSKRRCVGSHRHNGNLSILGKRPMSTNDRPSAPVRVSIPVDSFTDHIDRSGAVSHQIDIGAIGFGHIGISCIKFLSNSASLPVAANATNSDSIVQPVMHVYFLEAHEMAPPPSRNTHPLVEDESST